MLTNDEAGDIIKSTKQKKTRNEKIKVKKYKWNLSKGGTDHQKHNLNPG